MKRLSTLFARAATSICLAVAISCCGAPTGLKYSVTPIPKEPALTSVVKDKNDTTGKEGVWMDFSDLRSLQGFIIRLFSGVKERDAVIRSYERLQ